MRSKELGRLGYLPTLFFAACLVAGSCGGGTSSGTTGNPAETGGTSGVPGGAGGGTGSTSVTGGAGGSVATGGNVGATGGSLGTGGSLIGTGGIGASATGGGTATPGDIFKQCRFHFGTSSGKVTSALLPELDLVDSGWLTSATFGWSRTCSSTAAGGQAAGLVPTVFGYVAAGMVKASHSLCDCNVTGCSGGNLCQYGSQYITQDWASILAAYTSHSAGFAACMGGRHIIFRMEPDWYQYIGNGQSQPWTAAEAGTMMTALVQALGSSLPNAVFSMDISPWIGNNGASWYPNFDMSLFTFINTSGGNSDGSIAKIRSGNNMTWAGVHQVTGKPILADTGYGAAGASTGEDPTWNVAANINARMLDGVIAIIQPNPSATWGDTVAGMQSQLNTPPNCY